MSLPLQIKKNRNLHGFRGDDLLESTQTLVMALLAIMKSTPTVFRIGSIHRNNSYTHTAFCSGRRVVPLLSILALHVRYS